jgi:hypothetical protein
VPKASTRPATPRNDAADRYSPPIADALRPGRTVREATKKSLVVRENRQPYAPTASVATKTAVTPMTLYPAAVTSGSARP